MPRISTDNYDTVAAWNGSQDLFVVEQSDGTKVATPAQVKQYVLGNSIDDIYSVMGQMGAKNLIPYPYANTTKTASGITWTDNGDGTVTADGTNTASGNNNFTLIAAAANYTLPNGKYKLSGAPDNAYIRILTPTVIEVGGEGNETEFTLNDESGFTVIPVVLTVLKNATVNNITFKPMLRLASDTDNTYQPYAKTNRQLTEDKAELVSVRDYVNELGVKNLLVPKWTETQTTENGVTYTFNADGTIIMNTDESGATADTNCNLRNKDVTTNNLFPAGSYIFTGCPEGGSATTYRTWLRAYRPNTATALTTNLYEAGEGVSFTISEPFTLGINATIRKNYVCNNLTWKPMLRLASNINDDTYVPFAMTNKQLTDGLDATKEQISDLTTKKVNTWMPDVYDFDTKVKTLDSNICTTYVQKIGDLTVAYLGVDSGTDLGSFSTMMQLRGFPEGCTRCIGGYIYNSSLESSPRVVQASNVGVYFRPNITGSMSSGYVCALLFFN